MVDAPIGLAAENAAASAPDPPVGGGEREVPVYATQLPPPAVLRYAMQRGALRGVAELRWQHDGDHYTLALQRDGDARQALGSTSSGGVDAHGLAPERHSESRRGRELRAVNFRRETARITFSGPQIEVPLTPGAQDRLSWLLQLAAIAQANPLLRGDGSQIALFVAGTRGDAAVWDFAVVGREAIDLPAGAVPDALHLHRAASRPYDTEVDVWLDPARQHLPVRVRLLARPAPEAMELSLQSIDPP